MLVKEPKLGTRTLSSFFSAPAKYDKPPNLYKPEQKSETQLNKMEYKQFEQSKYYNITSN